MIGIIIPPGQIKKFADKTAEHVALHGSQFEKMIIQRQQHKRQFCFLHEGNPYRAYYDHMVGEFSKKLIQEGEGSLKQPQQDLKQQVKQEEPKQIQSQQAFLEKIFEEIQQPDQQKYTAEIPQKITQAQQSIIQLTAQFVARNGKNFLIALSQRQKNNPQFQFLKSSSKFNKYFNILTQAYIAILAMNDQDIQNLVSYATDKSKIMQKCEKIFEYYSQKQDQSKGKKTQQNQHKKQQNIDWNDFQLVDTIVFDNELYGNHKIEQGIKQIRQNPNIYSKNMQQKIIVEAKKKQILQLCNVCGKKVIATEMTKHLKMCLRGKGNQDKSSIDNGGFEVNMKQHLDDMSGRMTHVFGKSSQKIVRAEQDDNQKIIWDGQAPNITRVTASIAMLANQQKKIKQNLYKKGQ